MLRVPVRLALKSPRPAGRLAGLLALALGLPALEARGLEDVPDFGPNPGGLRMWKHVPAGLPAGAPLVVLLHGCSQQAADFDDEIGFLGLADELGFALALAEQRPANNPSLCFQWFEASEVARDQGEALSVRQMVARMLADHPLDPARVFVAGLSSGGAMAVALLAAYPEVFAGGGSVAGLPSGCARSWLDAAACMSGGVDRTPAEWGDLVRAASPHAGPWPALSIFAAELDATVDPENGIETAEQWTDVHGLDFGASFEEGLGSHRRRVWRDADGRDAVELVWLTGAGHGMPVGPAGGQPPCGAPGPYRFDAGICAARWLAAFWGLDGQAPGDGGADDGGDGEAGIDAGDAAPDGQETVEEADAPADEPATADSGDASAEGGGGCACGSSPSAAPPWLLGSLLALWSSRSLVRVVSGIRTRARSSPESR